jgi:hypothetical protein
MREIDDASRAAVRANGDARYARAAGLVRAAGGMWGEER